LSQPEGQSLFLQTWWFVSLGCRDYGLKFCCHMWPAHCSFGYSDSHHFCVCVCVWFCLFTLLLCKGIPPKCNVELFPLIPLMRSFHCLGVIGHRINPAHLLPSQSQHSWLKKPQEFSFTFFFLFFLSFFFFDRSCLRLCGT
jgi:hypothetical protein